MADLPELLGSCDYVCNILPSTSQTQGVLCGDMLQHCATKVNPKLTCLLFVVAVDAGCDLLSYSVAFDFYQHWSR